MYIWQSIPNFRNFRNSTVGLQKHNNFFHVWIHLSTDLMVGQIRILHSYLKSILKYRLWENWTIVYYFSRSPKVWETQVRIRDISKQSSDIQRPRIKSHEMVFWEWEAYFFLSFNFRLKKLECLVHQQIIKALCKTIEAKLLIISFWFYPL